MASIQHISNLLLFKETALRMWRDTENELVNSKKKHIAGGKNRRNGKLREGLPELNNATWERLSKAIDINQINDYAELKEIVKQNIEKSILDLGKNITAISAEITKIKRPWYQAFYENTPILIKERGVGLDPTYIISGLVIVAGAWIIYWQSDNIIVQ